MGGKGTLPVVYQARSPGARKATPRGYRSIRDHLYSAIGPAKGCLRALTSKKSATEVPDSAQYSSKGTTQGNTLRRATRSESAVTNPTPRASARAR